MTAIARDTARSLASSALTVMRVWANLRHGTLDIAVAEITKKTDISITIKSLERSKHWRVTSVTFVIKEQAVPDAD